MKTTIAVIVDDAAHARRLLAPMAREKTEWVLVVCPPRLTQRIGKWVSHSNREQWRAKWVAKLVAELAPALEATPGSKVVETIVAKRPLQEVVSKLRGGQGIDLRVLDARRPKLGQPNEAVADGSKPQATDPRWTVPIAVSSSLGVVLALTD